MSSLRLTSRVDYCNVMLAGHPSPPPTRFSEYFWMPPLVSSVAVASTTEVCLICCQAALVWRSTMSAEQTLHHCSSLSAEQGTSIPGWLLHSHLRHHQSAASVINQLLPAVHTATLMFGRQAFFVPGPMAWNSLPNSPRDLARFPDCSHLDFKTLLFSSYQHTQCTKGLVITALYKTMIDNDIDTHSSKMAKHLLHWWCLSVSQAVGLSWRPIMIKQVMWLLSPRSKAQASDWGCTHSTFLQILWIFWASEGYRLQFSIPHAYFVYMVWHCTDQHCCSIYACTYHLSVRGSPGECYYNTLLCCEDYFSSSSVALSPRTFSALCMYSMFGHHPHP